MKKKISGLQWAASLLIFVGMVLFIIAIERSPLKLEQSDSAAGKKEIMGIKVWNFLLWSHPLEIFSDDDAYGRIIFFR